MNLVKLIVNIAFIIKNIKSIVCLHREKIIADILIKNKLTLMSAESCTGGLISSRMTDVSGSSAYIMQNFVTYANKAKEQILGVNSKTIQEFGVVSEEVAKEMALGLLKIQDPLQMSENKSKIALSITGIAGPLGATETKRVGLVCICVANEKQQKTYTYQANSLLNRRIMKYAFSNKALDFLIDFLNENY